MTVISLAHANILRSQSLATSRIIPKAKTKRKLVISLIFLIIVFGFLYILQINNSTSKGYKIRSLKNQISELGEINKSYQVNISNLKSINFLQSKTEGLKMVKAQGIEYLAFPTTSVVVIK